MKLNTLSEALVWPLTSIQVCVDHQVNDNINIQPKHYIPGFVLKATVVIKWSLITFPRHSLIYTAAPRLTVINIQ